MHVTDIVRVMKSKALKCVLYMGETRKTHTIRRGETCNKTITWKTDTDNINRDPRPIGREDK